MSAHGNLPGAGGQSYRITDENLFRYLIDFEVQKAPRLQYCISVACLGADIGGNEAGAFSAPHVLDAILRCTRVTDVVTPLPDASFAILLIDAETSELAAIIRRLKDEVSAVTGVPIAGTQALTWSVGGACYPKTATSGRELLRQALDLMKLARSEGGDRFYIAS